MIELSAINDGEIRVGNVMFQLQVTILMFYSHNHLKKYNSCTLVNVPKSRLIFFLNGEDALKITRLYLKLFDTLV